MCNRGRHGSPWNGRNVCLGIEDVSAFFADGIAASNEPNFLTEQGIPTAVTLNPKRPTVVNYIQGAVRIPKGFDRVRTVLFQEQQISLVAYSGKIVVVPLNWKFIFTGKCGPA
jgi:hypothetical protein